MYQQFLVGVLLSGPDMPTTATNSSGIGVSSMYKEHDPDKYYIKLDDDIMFIRNGSFEAMLQEKQKDRFWLVSANVVNHPSEQLLGMHISDAACFHWRHPACHNALPKHALHCCHV